MIYIKDIRDGDGNSFNVSFNKSFARTKGFQTIYIPKHFDTEGEMVLKLTSVAELGVYSYPVKDLGGSGNYYRVKFPLNPSAPAGEYNFQLLGGDVVLSEGILIKDGCADEGIEFNKDITYRQYESEEC